MSTKFLAILKRLGKAIGIFLLLTIIPYKLGELAANNCIHNGHNINYHAYWLEGVWVMIAVLIICWILYLIVNWIINGSCHD